MRSQVEHLIDSYRVSERRACEAIKICRSSHRYCSKRKDDRALRLRVREIAGVRVRYGYKRIHVLLRREGWRVNHKRIYRIYGEEGLNLRRRRPRRHVSGSRRMDRPPVEYPNACWSMDFVCDSLFNGRRFRALTVVDNFSRECPAIEVGQSITGKDVVAVMDRLVNERGVPDRIQCDNVLSLESSFFFGHTDPCSSNSLNQINPRWLPPCLDDSFYHSDTRSMVVALTVLKTK